MHEMQKQVLYFWFDEIDSALWWKKDPQLDQLILERFGDLHTSAAQGELFQWRTSAEGRLAEIIVLDQFSRNLFRDSPKAYAQDAMALVLAQEAVSIEAHTTLPPVRRSFMLMPYMHSESLTIHHQAVELFNQPGMENNLDFEQKHKAIIERFGRYPHRNALLGRISTKEEVEFLKQPGSRF